MLLFFCFDFLVLCFCLLNPCNVVCTVVPSQPGTVDMTVTFFSALRRLEVKSDRIESNSHFCAQRTLNPFCVVSHSCSFDFRVFSF